MFQLRLPFQLDLPLEPLPCRNEGRVVESLAVHRGHAEPSVESLGRMGAAVGRAAHAALAMAEVQEPTVGPEKRRRRRVRAGHSEP